MANQTIDLSKTDITLDDKTIVHGEIPLEIKYPEYTCPVHGNIKARTMRIEDLDNNVELAHCCMRCLADLINEHTPKIEQIG